MLRNALFQSVMLRSTLSQSAMLRNAPYMALQYLTHPHSASPSAHATLRFNLQSRYTTSLSMDTTGAEQQKKKKPKRKLSTSYSRMTIREAEQRLQFRIDELQEVPVHMILEKPSIEGLDMNEIKEKVYRHILEYIDIEGYPTEASTGYKEAKVSDLVLYVIGPILSDFKRKTRRNIRLEREKQIISVDDITGGMDEFVVIDRIEVSEEKFVLIIEAKKSNTGEAIKQCLLSLKDAWDNNGQGEVFGFITTGRHWQMARYDGISFVMTEEFTALFRTMEHSQKRWIDNYSDVVDCLYFALSKGVVAKEKAME
ncbi:hypothetical protein L211DRAFT_815272, partial [Terfezia boudieri ATCC MYA-4762]